MLSNAQKNELIGREQKQKYSNAIEKQSIKSTAVGTNGPGYLAVRNDISVKHLVSSGACAIEFFFVLCLPNFFSLVFAQIFQCRSFGDLTSLNSEEYNSNHFQHVYVSNLMILFRPTLLLLLHAAHFSSPFCAQLINLLLAS